MPPNHLPPVKDWRRLTTVDPRMRRTVVRLLRRTVRNTTPVQRAMRIRGAMLVTLSVQPPKTSFPAFLVTLPVQPPKHAGGTTERVARVDLVRCAAAAAARIVRAALTGCRCRVNGGSIRSVPFQLRRNECDSGNADSPTPNGKRSDLLRQQLFRIQRTTPVGERKPTISDHEAASPRRTASDGF